MKNTGIVRRIDELGRIVIPKEIRRTLRLSEGTQMEIYTNGYELVLKKHSVLSQVGDYASIIASSLHSSIEKSVIVCDLDEVMVVAGSSKKDYVNKSINTALLKLIKDRKSYILNASENATMHQIVEEDKSNYNCQIIVPIIANSDVVGCIVVFSTNKDDSFTPYDVKIVQAISNLFTGLLE